MVTVLKTVVGASRPRVRIPPPPPANVKNLAGTPAFHHFFWIHILKGIKQHTHQDREKVVSEMIPVIKEYFGDNLIALAAQASYARGDDADYSDLEFIAFLEKMPEGNNTQGMARIRDGMLIELTWMTREAYVTKIKDVNKEWYISGSDVLLPLINEEFISELNSYNIENLKGKCLKQAERQWPEVQESTTKLLNAIDQKNRQGLPMLVFYVLKDILISLAFLNMKPFTTLAKYIPEARTFEHKPTRCNELIDMIVKGEYQDLGKLKELTISVFKELERTYQELGCRLYDDSPELKIERNW
jgi:hypothetical protein